MESDPVMSRRLQRHTKSRKPSLNIILSICKKHNDNYTMHLISMSINCKYVVKTVRTDILNECF